MFILFNVLQGLDVSSMCTHLIEYFNKSSFLTQEMIAKCKRSMHALISMS